MTHESAAYLDKRHGWAIGAGPTIVARNEPVPRQLTSPARKDTACAFIFDQEAPMVSLSIEAPKISCIER